MAQRPIWRGHLRLALVSCPVALYSTRHDHGAIHFHMINPRTGHRIKTVAQDGETGEELSRQDLVKGYEFKKDQYLLLDQADLDSVKVESSATMTVEKFVDAGSIDPLFYDTGYYVAPDGKGGEDVYAVLREAFARTGRVALSRVVVAQRERTIAIRPFEGGLVAHTLSETRDLNNPGDLFDPAALAKVDPEMVELAVQLIDRQTGRYDPADAEDRYETRLRAMIEAKLQGRGLDYDGEAQEPAGENVIDLMAALRKSLGEQSAKKAAKPAAAAKTVKKAAASKAAKPKPRKRA